MNKAQAKADELHAHCEKVAYALLCVGPNDMSITSRTSLVGSTPPDPEATAKLEQWLRDDLALCAAREKLAVLAEPVLVPDTDQNGRATLTILAMTLPWQALRWTE